MLNALENKVGKKRKERNKIGRKKRAIIWLHFPLSFVHLLVILEMSFMIKGKRRRDPAMRLAYLTC